MLSRLGQLRRDHPLLCVMLIAIALRAVAVVFSRGFMASDDHYETVSVAYYWLQHGFFSDQGWLLWHKAAEAIIARFPLYTFSLYVVMKGYLIAGIDDLDTMMYGIRIVHAGLSLISVYCVYRIVALVTKSRDWAFAAGLIMAAQFAMPFLAVRTLIEVVSGHFWMLALLFLYKYRPHGEDRWLLLAGLVTGLAWMIRFEIAFAAVAVPFVLWYEYRRLRPAVLYTAAVFFMLLISGVVDYYVIGQFAGSTISHIKQVITEPPPYRTSFLLYPAVLLGFLLPPVSLIGFYLCGFKSFWRQHRVLFFSSLVFVVAHMLSASRQERYMLPIIPPLVVLLTLAVWYHFQHRGFFQRHRRLFNSVLGVAVVINMILLVPLTVNYGKRGVVEPLVRIEKIAVEPGCGVVFVTPEEGRIFPDQYGGFQPLRRGYIQCWGDMSRQADINRQKPFDFFILYPPERTDLPRYIDSLETHFGPLDEVCRIGASPLEWVLHFVNPRYNKRNEAWLFRRSVQPNADIDPADPVGAVVSDN